jgi:3D (Asp-Asp-Asp) domain-containing protein
MAGVKRRALGLALLAVALGAWPAPAPADVLAGRTLGAFKLTFYHLARETERGEVPLFGTQCGVLARTSRRFHDELATEGAGLLADGRLLNFERRCPCALPAPDGERLCYAEVPRAQFPWGRGATRPGGHFTLQPFRSVAVDPAVVALGTVLYIPQLAGLEFPPGNVTNGCFRAEDTGRAVRGRHLDVFVGRPDWYRTLQRIRPLRSITVYRDSRRCARAFP